MEEIIKKQASKNDRLLTEIYTLKNAALRQGKEVNLNSKINRLENEQKKLRNMLIKNGYIKGD